MRVLLTGSNGLFGQHLLPLLCKDSDLEVIASGLGQNRGQGDSYSYHSCDLTDEAQVKSLILNVRPDYIIHAAARTQVDWCEKNKEECWLSNVDATQFLVSAADHLNCQFQYISSDFVFSGRKGSYNETHLPDPVNYYGRTKQAAEEIILNLSKQSSILRTVLVYGIAKDLSRSNILTWIWQNLRANQPITVVTDQVRTPTYVEDLVMGSYLILKKGASGIFHISGEQIMTPYDMAIQVARLFDLDEDLIAPVDGSTFSQPGKRPQNTSFIIEKAKKSLGFQPRPLEECLKSMQAALLKYPR